MSSEIEELREELAEARAELERVNERRGDMDARIAYFGPMHGESIRRLQITTEADGDILSVAEQEHHKGQRLLWLEVMRIRGSYGGHDICSLYLSPDEAESLRDLLTAYVEAARVNEPRDPRLYDEDGNANPLMRASEFCAAFYDWRRALTEAIEDPDVPEHRKVEFRQFVASLNALELPIRKSNYLWRRIYLAQQHRTEKCPDHKGAWSGYGTSPYVCACMSGYDVTGWLPVEGDAQAERCAPDPNLTADGTGSPFGV